MLDTVWSAALCHSFVSSLYIIILGSGDAFPTLTSELTTPIWIHAAYVIALQHSMQNLGPDFYNRTSSSQRYHHYIVYAFVRKTMFYQRTTLRHQRTAADNITTERHNLLHPLLALIDWNRLCSLWDRLKCHGDQRVQKPLLISIFASLAHSQ